MSFQPLTIFDQGFLGVGGELSQGHVTVNHEPNISCYMRHKTRKVRPGREPARQNKALGTKVLHMVFNRLQSVNITETGNVGVRLRRRAPIHLEIPNVTVYYQFRRVLSLFVAEVWAMKKQFFRLKNILPNLIFRLFSVQAMLKISHICKNCRKYLLPIPISLQLHLRY